MSRGNGIQVGLAVDTGQVKDLVPIQSICVQAWAILGLVAARAVVPRTRDLPMHVELLGHVFPPSLTNTTLLCLPN